MLVTASTVKDALPNVQRFVRRNLAGGVDHLLVFLDADDAADREVGAWLDGHTHVTCVRAHDAWWAGDRPPGLNDRQRTNANVARALMTVLDPDGWVVHVDGDEVVQVDRGRLDQVPDDVPVLRLDPLEAVSRARCEGEVTLFKRLLGTADLELLTTLGVLPRPRNGAYFHGHVVGKSAMRPHLERWHTIHRVVDADQVPVPAQHPGWARVLHYESPSGEEFVRKWTTMLGAGPTPSLRPGRRSTAAAVRTLLAKDLDEALTRRHLARIYQRTVQDDVATLLELDLLERVDPDAGSHLPSTWDPSRAALLGHLLEALAGEPKGQFHPGRPAAPVAELLRRVVAAAP